MRMRSGPWTSLPYRFGPQLSEKMQMQTREKIWPLLGRPPIRRISTKNTFGLRVLLEKSSLNSHPCQRIKEYNFNGLHVEKTDSTSLKHWASGRPCGAQPRSPRSAPAATWFFRTYPWPCAFGGISFAALWVPLSPRASALLGTRGDSLVPLASVLDSPKCNTPGLGFPACWRWDPVRTFIKTKWEEHGWSIQSTTHACDIFVVHDNLPNQVNPPVRWKSKHPSRGGLEHQQRKQ